MLLLMLGCKGHTVTPPVSSAPKIPPVSRPTESEPQTSSTPSKPPAHPPAPSQPQIASPEVKPLVGPSRWIRIGLATDLRAVKITSPGAMDIETLSESGHPRQVATGEVMVRLRAGSVGSGEEAASKMMPPSDGIYRIQIASMSDSERAEVLRREVASRLKAPAVIQYNALSETYRVRVGEFSNREKAEAFSERLREIGLGGGWITHDEVPPEPTSPMANRNPESVTAASPRLEIQSPSTESLGSSLLPRRSLSSVPVLRISPANPEQYLRYDNLPYRGEFELVENVRGELNLVNVVDLEDYLKGVVPNEMPPSKFNAIEALKAQAVAARTYVLKNMSRFAREGYNLCATISCQVYRGVSSERPLSSEAVEATRGVVIKYQGELINSLFTSTCGGQTENAENIFHSEGAPYLRSTYCPPENAPEIDPRLVAVSGYHLNWTVRETRAELEKNLRRILPLDTLVDIQPLRYGRSERVIELKVVGRSRDFVLRGLDVKAGLGLKDSLFTFQRVYGRHGEIAAFEFTGRGWGHGVGLCQTGAFGLARAGEDFETILKTYYRGVEVVKEQGSEN